MNKKTKQNTSKYLSFLLRHNQDDILKKLNKPDDYEPIDKEGYIFISDILEVAKISLEDLKDIVDSDSKSRYSYHPTKLKIRANQGHSSKKVNMTLDVKVPPETLFHGTATRFKNIIFKEGLKPMNRHHVHLSDNLKTASEVGKRHGDLYIFKIDTQSMIKDGLEFYISDNNVWLCNKIDPKYFIQ